MDELQVTPGSERFVHPFHRDRSFKIGSKKMYRVWYVVDGTCPVVDRAYKTFGEACMYISCHRGFTDRYVIEPFDCFYLEEEEKNESV